MTGVLALLISPYLSPSLTEEIVREIKRLPRCLLLSCVRHNNCSGTSLANLGKEESEGS